MVPNKASKAASRHSNGCPGYTHLFGRSRGNKTRVKEQIDNYVAAAIEVAATPGSTGLDTTVTTTNDPPNRLRTSTRSQTPSSSWPTYPLTMMSTSHSMRKAIQSHFIPLGTYPTVKWKNVSFLTS